MSTVLIAEDDIQIRAMLKETLELEGHDVLEAADGAAALAVLNEKQADLIITDILMPEKEGLSLIKELRKEKPELKIIAISGGSTNLMSGCNLELASMFGAHCVFSKPLDIDALLAKIAELTG